MRPYVWDLISTTNQLYMQLVQAVMDSYLEQRHFVVVYAQMQPMIFAQLYLVLKTLFEP